MQQNQQLRQILRQDRLSPAPSGPRLEVSAQGARGASLLLGMAMLHSGPGGSYLGSPDISASVLCLRLADDAWGDRLACCSDQKLC